MGYTHDHDVRPSGSLQVDSNIHAHLKLAHDIEDAYSMTANVAYAYHDCLDTHVPWEKQDETNKRDSIMSVRRSKNGSTKKQRKAARQTPKRTYVRKSVAEALADMVAFTRRPTWQELRAEKGTYLIEVTHTMLVEVTDDFDAVCFAAANHGAMPTEADDVSTAGEQLELGYIADFDFDNLEKQDRPQIVDESFTFREVEAPLSTVT